jgi:Tat protein translocase TatB subunit
LFDLGPEKIAVVMVIALVVFGPKRLPEVARNIGNALRTVRGAQDDIRNHITATLNGDELPPSPRVVSIEAPTDLTSHATDDDPPHGASFI